MELQADEKRRFTFKKISIATIAFFATLLIIGIVGGNYIVKNIRERSNAIFA